MTFLVAFDFSAMAKDGWPGEDPLEAGSGRMEDVLVVVAL